MKYLFLLSFLLVSCGTVQRKAPRFDVPSTVPIHQAADGAAKRLSDAQADVARLEKECPQARGTILNLRRDLDGARDEILRLGGALSSLDVQLAQVTKKANGLADSYDTAGARITSLDGKLAKSRSHSRWLLLGLLGCLVWIFRGPIASLGGFVLRKFVGIPL